MPILVFHGDDHFSVARALERVTRDGGFDDVEIARISAKSASAPSVRMSIATAGLFSTRRLVILEGLGTTGDGKKSAKTRSSKDVLTLAGLVETVPESTTLVVILTGQRPDSMLLKEAMRLARAGSVKFHGFPAPKQREMPAWIAKRAKELGIKMEPRAAQRLALRVGEQVSLAGMELRKLTTAAGPDQAITVDLVERLVPQSAEESIFPLIDAIANGSSNLSFQLLERQLAFLGGNQTDLSLRLIRLLARQFRILLRVRLLVARGSKRGEVIGELKIPEYFSDRYFAQAQRLTLAQLESAVKNMAAAEYAIKNGEAGEVPVHLLVGDLTDSRALVSTHDQPVSKSA